VIERRIKNLSIALEALSRINHPRIDGAFESVERLLTTAIAKAHEENHPPSPPPPYNLDNLDNDIPF